MSDENKYTIDDMINFATQQKPVDVRSAFDDLMMSKIHSAIENKKIEVARQMFGDANVDAEIEADDAEFEDEQDADAEEEITDDETTEDDEDLDLDISDEELEDLLSDLEDNLEDDNLDPEEEDNGENA